MRKLSVSFFFIVLFLFTCGVQDGFARKKKKGVRQKRKRKLPQNKDWMSGTCFGAFLKGKI